MKKIQRLIISMIIMTITINCFSVFVKAAGKALPVSVNPRNCHNGAEAHFLVDYIGSDGMVYGWFIYDDGTSSYGSEYADGFISNVYPGAIFDEIIDWDTYWIVYSACPSNIISTATSTQDVKSEDNNVQDSVNADNTAEEDDVSNEEKIPDEINLPVTLSRHTHNHEHIKL